MDNKQIVQAFADSKKAYKTIKDHLEARGLYVVCSVDGYWMLGVKSGTIYKGGYNAEDRVFYGSIDGPADIVDKQWEDIWQIGSTDDEEFLLELYFEAAMQ